MSSKKGSVFDFDKEAKWLPNIREAQELLPSIIMLALAFYLALRSPIMVAPATNTLPIWDIDI